MRHGTASQKTKPSRVTWCRPGRASGLNFFLLEHPETTSAVPAEQQAYMTTRESGSPPTDYPYMQYTQENYT